MPKQIIPTSSKTALDQSIEAIIRSVSNMTDTQKKDFLGVATLLRDCDNYHKDYDAEEIRKYFLQPILNGTYVTVWQDDKMMSIGIYGYLSEDVVRKWLTHHYDLTGEDWNSGSQIWLVDILAPYGHGIATCRELRKRAGELNLLGKNVNFIRTYKDGRYKKEQMKL